MCIMKKYVFLFILLLISTLVYPQNKRGIALIIGNSNYSKGYLKNPVNDATAVGKKLQTLGFDVLLHTDLDLGEMEEIANSFIDKASNYDVALFYYAGHGIESQGINYLLPLNANLVYENDIKHKCINLEHFIENLNYYTKCKLKFVMIDACRDNPLERSFTRSIHTGGLVKQNTPIGTLISYATDYGKTAKDGEGEHSPYTSAFLELLDRPNMEYKDLFEEIKYLVYQRTNHQQLPVVEDKIYERGSFCFNYKQQVVTVPAKSLSHSTEENYVLGKHYYDNQNYDKAIDYYKEAAEQGNAEAQNSLGIMYYNGEGVEKNYTEAVKWYRKAAEQGNADAHINLGNRYYYGEGVEKNYSEAVKWYRKAAEQGNARGQNNLGLSYYNGEGVEKNYTEAVKWFRKAAEQGYAWAQNSLGIMYYNGEGIEKNYSEAVKWYRKAAEQGNAASQNNLGIMYYNGEGVEKNYSEAVKWYRKAAEQGEAVAQYNLGIMYVNGEGVEKNYTEAVKWYRKAAEQGYAEAQNSLGYSYYNGEGVEKNYSEAVKWYRKAAEQGDAEAQVNLGDRYLFGEGVEVNDTEAIKWYRKAAEQGDAYAQCTLGAAYEVVEANYTEAVKWYRKAAEQGNAAAQYNLGNRYYYGEGVEKNYTEAVKWYRKAAEQGHSNAKKKIEELELSSTNNTNEKFRIELKNVINESGSNLNPSQILDKGNDYYFGRNGVKKDYTEAVKWYRKAAELGNPKAQNSLAKCYEHGLGVKINHQEVIKWYNKAAEQGYYEAYFNLGNYYHHLTDYDNAYTSYSKGSNVGEPYSQVALAEWHDFYYRQYCSTHDIKYDYEYDKVKELFSKAENAIQKSAKEGEPLALIALSIMYKEYYYEPQTRSTYNKNFDTEEYENIDELKYLSQAAEGNDGYALYKLAEYYDLVYALTKNNKYSALGIGFAQKAYEKGYIYATTLLGEIYWRLNDSENSKYWFTVGKDIGLASSIHHYGLNCSDPKEKLSYLTSSLEQGYLGSYYELGKIYYDGNIVNKDYKKAFYYFKKGAELGSDICRPYVALCYLNGHGVKKDIDEAKKWYKKANIKLQNKDLNAALE